MKYMWDHPTFERLVLAAEVAAIEYHEKVTRLFLKEGIIDPRRAADRAARAFRRRLYKQFGLIGRYLPHEGAKQRGSA